MLAAQDERGTTHRVVDAPELQVLLGNQRGLRNARIVMSAQRPVVVSAQPRLGEEAPLGIAVRAEGRGDGADVLLGLLDAAEARRLSDIGSDARKRLPGDDGAYVVQHQARYRRARLGGEPHADEPAQGSA